MRKLILKDTFSMAKIIKRYGLKEQYVKLFGDETKTNDEKGMEFIMSLMELASNDDAERDIYNLLGGIMENEDIEHAALDDVLEQLKQIATENNVIGFFKSALKMRIQ